MAMVLTAQKISSLAFSNPALLSDRELILRSRVAAIAISSQNYLTGRREMHRNGETAALLDDAQAVHIEND